MNTALKLDIVTPDKPVAAETVAQVTLPGESGEMTFLPDHIEIVSSLDIGQLYYKIADGKEEKFVVRGGFVQLQDNKVVVLTEKATNLKEVNKELLRETKNKIESDLGKTDLSNAERITLLLDLKETELLLTL